MLEVVILGWCGRSVQKLIVRRLVVVWYGGRYWAGYVSNMLVVMVLGVGVVLWF